jgi:hypothetical protein
MIHKNQLREQANGKDCKKYEAAHMGINYGKLLIAINAELLPH